MRKTAGKCLLQIAALLRRNLKPAAGADSVDRLPIGLRRGGDVMSALEPALDLDARHARVGEVIDQVIRRQILRRQQIRLFAKILDFAIDDQIVWKLGTPAPHCPRLGKLLLRQAIRW